MTSTGGLSRRRVPNTSSSTSPSDDPDDAWGLNGSTSNGTVNGGSVSQQNSVHSSLSHGGSAFEGGSKIAYDPRDLEREDEDVRQGGKAPRLTIMEEVLLLGLKDKQVSVHCGCYQGEDVCAFRSLYTHPPSVLLLFVTRRSTSHALCCRKIFPEFP